jgi:hypothetical protein
MVKGQVAQEALRQVMMVAMVRAAQAVKTGKQFRLI